MNVTGNIVYPGFPDTELVPRSDVDARRDRSGKRTRSREEDHAVALRAA